MNYNNKYKVALSFCALFFCTTIIFMVLFINNTPTDPPTDPPTQPPTDPPTQPPTDPPTQPPVSYFRNGLVKGGDMKLLSYDIRNVNFIVTINPPDFDQGDVGHWVYNKNNIDKFGLKIMENNTEIMLHMFGVNLNEIYNTTRGENNIIEFSIIISSDKTFLMFGDKLLLTMYDTSKVIIDRLREITGTYTLGNLNFANIDMYVKS
jgi:hypothetical protein